MATGAITEYSSGLTASSGLRGICLGPDGNRWACAFSTNKIIKITSGGTITEYAIPTGTGPYRICSDGTRLWATCNGNNYLISITTAGTITEYNLGASKGPRSLVVGPDGNLWVAFQTASTIAKVVTSAGSVSSVTEYATTTGSAGPFGLCSDGTNLWATLNTVSKITKITTAGSVTEYSTTTGSAGPFDCCLGPDGNVWFTEQASGINQIAKITSGGTVTEYASVSADPQGIAAVNGELWVVLSSANKIGRYATSGSQIAEYTITTGSSSSRFITAAGSDLWFTESSGNKLSVIGGALTTTKTVAVPVFGPATQTVAVAVPVVADVTLGSLSSDYFGRVSGTATVPTGCTSLKVYRSTSSGGTYVDITSNCAISGSAPSITFTDKRPAYGSQAVALNATGYYKVAGVFTSPVGPVSSYSSGVSTYDREQVERQQWTKVHAEMAVQATRENSSHLSYAYPGRWLVNAAYIAASYTDLTTEALTDLDTWWTFVKTQINADNLFIAGGYSSSFYTAHHSELIVYVCACARLLRERLSSNGTATTLAADMISKADAMGVALIDLSRDTVTARGYSADWPVSVSAATAWTGSTSTALGTIRKPTSGATRMYRNINPSGGTTGSTEPTWPTTTRGIVTDGTVYWQECTTDSPRWTAGETIQVGDIRRPLTPISITRSGTVTSGSRNVTGLSTTSDLVVGMTVSSSLGTITSILSSTSVQVSATSGVSTTLSLTFTAPSTYRALNAGTTHASTEPTWPATLGATVTDNGITWKETGVSAASVSYVTRGNSSPYTPSGSGTKIGDELARVACAFAVLYTDADATHFYTGGTKRSTAATVITDHLKLAGALQVGDGALAQDVQGYQAYDSLYASFTLHLSAIALNELGSSFEESLSPSVSAALRWLTAYYGTEPAISNAGSAGHPTGSIVMAEMAWRSAAYSVAGQQNPIDTLRYTSALWPSTTYNQAGYAAGTVGTDVNFLAMGGLPSAFNLPVTVSQAVAVAIKGTRTTTASVAVAVTGSATTRTKTQLVAVRVEGVGITKTQPVAVRIYGGPSPASIATPTSLTSTQAGTSSLSSAQSGNSSLVPSSAQPIS